MDSGTTGWNAAGLGDYLSLLRRRWPTIVAFLVLGLLLALAYLQVAPREFTARTAVLVTSTTAGVPESERGSTINLDTEAQLVTATGTVADVAERLDVSLAEVNLVDRVTITVPPNTEILEIAYVGGSASEAQQGSLAFAESYLAQRRGTAEASLEAESEALQTRMDTIGDQLDAVLKRAADLPAESSARARAEQQADVLNNQLALLAGQQTQIRAATVSPGRIVTEPALPSAPTSPDPLLTLVAGGLIGLLGGLAVAVLRQRSDDVLHSPEDVSRRTRLPVAAVLADRLQEHEVRLVTPLSPDGRGYARLRNLVGASVRHSDRRVVLVAGVRRGGGPVAANLAASLARAGEDVVLVCADVFGESAGSLLPRASAPGLAEVLNGERAVEGVLQRLENPSTLRVLGPGLDPDRADALLQTDQARALVDRLLASSSYVVIEAPATAGSADVQTLVNVAGVAVLVVEANHTTGREVVDACAQLEAMGTPVLGAVVARYDREQRRKPSTSDGDTRDVRGEDTRANSERRAVEGAVAEPTRQPRPAVTAASGTAEDANRR
jgi:Mrp family chromosome partitioning ATPase